MELAGANPPEAKAPPPPPKSKAPEVQNIVRHKGGAMTLAAVPKVGDSVPPSTTEDPLAPALVPQVVPNDTEADSASRGKPAEDPPAAPADDEANPAPRGRRMRAGTEARVQRALWPKRRSQRTTLEADASSPQPKPKDKCPMHDLPDASCQVCSWLASGKLSPEKGLDHRRRSARHRSESGSHEDLSPKRTPQSRRRRHSPKGGDDYDRAVAASLLTERLQAEGRTLDGQFAVPPKDWPPQHPGGYQSLKYFGIEVPTLCAPAGQF